MLEIDISAKNNRRAPMEYTYLSHINSSVRRRELVCSAPYDPAHVKYTASFRRGWSRTHTEALDYMDAIAADPKVQAVIDTCVVPEVCMTLL